MKLNLVADYELPNGSRFAAAFAIDQSQNLVALGELCSLSFPVLNGGRHEFISVDPVALTMCESRRKAKEIEEWRKRDYQRQGRLYDFEPLDLYEIVKAREGEVA